jgi:hypothetical protein
MDLFVCAASLTLRLFENLGSATRAGGKSNPRGPCRCPPTVAGDEVGEFLDHPCKPVDAQPDLEPVGTEVHQRHQQLQRAGLLGREDLAHMINVESADGAGFGKAFLRIEVTVDLKIEQ